MASEMSERIAMAWDYLLARGVPEAENVYAVNYEGARGVAEGWSGGRLSVSFDVLLGETITEIEAEQGGDVMRIECASGLRMRCYHEQDCCESVRVEDIVGDLQDLIGTPVTMAEVVTNSDDPPGEYADSWTWTFYKLATAKGYVTIRWLGESNGYYSEDVCVVCDGLFPREANTDG